jgi:hypothetical protein
MKPRHLSAGDFDFEVAPAPRLWSLHTAVELGFIAGFILLAVFA